MRLPRGEAASFRSPSGSTAAASAAESLPSAASLSSSRLASSKAAYGVQADVAQGQVRGGAALGGVQVRVGAPNCGRRIARAARGSSGAASYPGSARLLSSVAVSFDGSALAKA